METLAETKASLEVIKEQNKEIISLLDEIEKRRTQQTSPEENAAEKASCSGHANSNDTGKVSDTGKQTSINITDDSELKSVKQDASSLIDENTENDSSQSEDKNLDLSVKTKGILKTPDKGSKHSYGFKERLNLDLNHVMYGSQLRRTAVELQQDNRLCLHFGLPPNDGAMYESKRSFLDEEDEIASRSERRMEYSENGQTLQEPARKTVRMSDSVSDGSTAFNTSAQGRTKKSPEFALRLDNNTEQSNTKEQITPWQKRLAEVSNAEKGRLPHAPQVKETTIVKTEQEEALTNRQSQKQDIRQVSQKNKGQSSQNPKGQNQQKPEGQDTLKLEGQDSQNPEGQITQKATGNPENVRTNIGLLALKSKMSEHAETEDKEDTQEEESVYVDTSLWIQYANEEIKNGRFARDIREKGMDTIFCVDVSQSMRGIAWQQCTTFVKNFIDGIQNTTLNDEVFEHVALVTYGSETRVHQHMTCDYLEFNRKFARLKPNGPSPLYAGLQMVHAAVIGAGSTFSYAGFKMHPRVFLITDGKPTPLSLFAGPDNHAAFNSDQSEILQIVFLVKELNDKFHVTINPIPVGDFDLGILDMIAQHSNGKIVSPEDWRLQSRMFKNNMAAAKISAAASQADGAALLSDSVLSKFIFDAITPDASQEDKAQMEEFLRTHKKEDDEDSDDKEIDDFPPLGSRVCRRKAVASAVKKSDEEFGTVTKHMSDGHIGVTWDKPNADGTIREKVLYQDGYKGVKTVDKPRVLKDEMIAEGCRVKRGTDWHYGDQDGGDGKFGYVYSVKPNGIVSVRWDNGNKNTYMFGAEGKFDLEIVGQNVDMKKSDKESHHDVPSDEETEEEKRVKEMNKRNELIYDLVGTDKTVLGANSEPKEDSFVMDDVSKQRRNKNEPQKIRSKSEIFRKISVGLSQSEIHMSPSENDKGQRFSEKQDEANISVKTGSADLDYQFKGSTGNTGAKPKTNVKKPETQEEVTANWLWKDGDNWKEYPPDISEKIETDFKRNSRGTTLIRLNNVPFRVVFPRMEQINIGTKDKYAVQRNT